MAWWGSPWDKRGNTNAAIIVESRHEADRVWEEFCKAFPDLSRHLKRPIIE